MSHAASLALSAVLALPFATESRLIGWRSDGDQSHGANYTSSLNGESAAAQARIFWDRLWYQENEIGAWQADGQRVKDAAANALAVEVSQDILPLLPMPLPEASARQWHWLKITTGGDAASVADARLAIRNHKAYAQRHGYGYEVHTGNYASPWIAYWHKIDVLLHELRQPLPPGILVWMDLDVLVTNPTQRMFEDILAAHPNHAVILTEDAQRGEVVPDMEHTQRFVNTGMILVRSGPQAIRVLEELFEFGRAHRNAAYLPQASDTLHEQDAFNAMLSGARKHVWSRHVAVIPQRHGKLNLNNFARNFYDPQYQDPSEVEWVAGDFSAHCTGLRRQFREWCIKDSFAAAEKMSDLEKISASNYTRCDDMVDIQKHLYVLPHL